MPAPPRLSARILVVDDSAVVRRIITMALAAEPRFEVFTAIHGQQAVDMFDRVRPDAMTLDVEMPELDGLGVLRAFRQQGRRLPIIMFSTLTERGAAVTIDALTLGASDYVTKPSGSGAVETAIARVRAELIPKLRALLRMDGPDEHAALAPPHPPAAHPALAPARAEPTATSHPTPAHATPARTEPVAAQRLPAVPAFPARRGTPELLVVGVSTGGPSTLEALLSALPAGFPVPVVIVQHMPEHFTQQLAQRLDRRCALHVREAEDGAPVRRGDVWIARGGRHCEVRRDGSGLRLHLHDGAPVQFCRPSVDVLFHSAAGALPGRVLGLVLTGMGRDGADGAAALRGQGCDVIAQDEATSVVYGMPRVVAERGLATAILPLSQIAGGLARHLSAAGTPAPLAAL